MEEVQCVWEEPAVLGEGPLWVAGENAIYWVDIIKKKVYRYGLTDGEQRSWQFDIEITSLAERQQGSFVCTVRNGFALIDFKTGRIEPLHLLETDFPHNRFNDSKVDGHGRFWAGSMDEGEKLPSGTLYRLDADLTVHEMDRDYIITNGPAFSLDGRTIYHTDTIKRIVYALDCAADGSLSNKRPFIQLVTEEEGYPDGMAVDSEDCLWVCHFGGARITRYAPTGERLQIVPMPVPNITSCTFGGSDLDTMYITTARYLLSDAVLAQYPQAGSLFAYRPGVQGVPTPQFLG